MHCIFDSFPPSTRGRVETERFINITFNSSKNTNIFIKNKRNIKINNGWSNVYREGEADKAGPIDSATGSKAGPENRCQVRGLLVRIQWHPDFGQGFSQSERDS